MIRNFLMALLAAGIFSALVQPVYRKITRSIGNRRRLASLIVLALFLGIVLAPLAGLVGVITSQAIKVGKSVTPWVQQQIAQPSPFSQYLIKIPYYEKMAPYQEQILSKAGDLTSRISMFLVNSLSAGALGTFNFLFLFLIFLYASYFFMIDGQKLLDQILHYLPLDESNKNRLLERFTSVTRATLKGTAVIGVMQGGLAGLAFAVVGIEAAVFWGTIMAVLSIIPPFGAGLVWFPAVVILAVNGSYFKAIGLLLFCGLVVSMLDNLLRPRLVGKDTKMHDMLVLFSTLGGLSLFGPLGFIIGPIVAALFVTVWQIYGEAFQAVLPDAPRPASAQPAASAPADGSTLTEQTAASAAPLPADDSKHRK